MSAGAFERSRYEANNGDVHAIRVQPETEALVLNGIANGPTADPIDQNLRARVSGGNREYGLKARSATIAWTGAPPSGYEPDQLLRVPILTPDLYDSLIPDATTGTYLGANVIVVGLNPERRR